MVRQKLQQGEKAGVDQTGAAERKAGIFLKISKGKCCHVGIKCPVLHISTGRQNTGYKFQMIDLGIIRSKKGG